MLLTNATRTVFAAISLKFESCFVIASQNVKYEMFWYTLDARNDVCALMSRFPDQQSVSREVFNRLN